MTRRRASRVAASPSSRRSRRCPPAQAFPGSVRWGYGELRDLPRERGGRRRTRRRTGACSRASCSARPAGARARIRGRRLRPAVVAAVGGDIAYAATSSSRCSSCRRTSRRPRATAGCSRSRPSAARAPGPRDGPRLDEPPSLPRGRCLARAVGARGTLPAELRRVERQGVRRRRAPASVGPRHVQRRGQLDGRPLERGRDRNPGGHRRRPRRSAACRCRAAAVLRRQAQGLWSATSLASAGLSRRAGGIAGVVGIGSHAYLLAQGDLQRLETDGVASGATHGNACFARETMKGLYVLFVDEVSRRGLDEPGRGSHSYGAALRFFLAAALRAPAPLAASDRAAVFPRPRRWTG